MDDSFEIGACMAMKGDEQWIAGTACGRRSWYGVLAALVFAAVVSLAIDLPVAAYVQHGHCPKLLAELFENVETFGHGFGATLIIGAVCVLDPARRRLLPLLLAGSLGAGVVANVVKLLVVRSRPRSLNEWPATVWDTFGGGWFNGDGGSQSFPSAHTATAVGLAVILAVLYPRGRWYFVVLAILVGMQRIQCRAHFPSDVFAGAAVGWCAAVGCLTLWNRQTNHGESIKV